MLTVQTDYEVAVISPEDDDDLKALHKLCMMHGSEMAPVPVDETDVWHNLLQAQDSNHHWMLMAISGDRLVGYLNLVQQQWHFNRSRHFICDWGFFVLPECRNGEAGGQLLRVARGIAAERNMQLRISITNPRRRLGRRMNKEADIVGFTPLGSTLSFGQGQPSLLN
jgi:Acetyltransferase (GNAT) family